MRSKLSTALRILFALSLSLLLVGCSNSDSLGRIVERGQLIVVSRNGPATYFQDKEGDAGFEHILATKLAQQLAVELVMQPAFSLNDMFNQLQRSEVDVAAPGLVITRLRGEQFTASRPYATTVPQAIYRAGTFRPRSAADLVGMRIAVISGSNHADLLQNFKHAGNTELEWQEVSDIDTMDLLALIEQDNADIAILDSHEFRVQQSLFPRLRVAFDIAPEQQLTWLLPPSADHQRLLEVIDQLLLTLELDGTMDQLREQQFGHTKGVSRVGSHTFSLNMRKTFPKYRQMIERVAAEYQLDPHLLAAISYQESHWNPRAVSPTGVRGMMMLTLTTARELGIDNRLDSLQSLRGGARYFKDIKRRLPGDIDDPDRTWFALAAYNIGMGHLEDARVLTERQGGDPHLWPEVMQRLPLLQQSKYYKTLRYGYARGSEPVTYVQNIRHYRNILKWQGISRDRPLPPIDVEPLVPDRLREIELLAL